jgi:AraC-like DNA-binding protein
MNGAVVLGYREAPAEPGLSPDVACLWTQDVSTGSAPAVHRVIPDGCIDLVWGLDDSVQVAGPDTGPVLAALRPGTRLAGLRFRSGRAARFLRVPASELVDTRVSLEEVWAGDSVRLAERLSERLAAAPTRAAQLRILAAMVHERLATAPAPDRLVATAVRQLSAGRAPVAALARDLGVSERHLLRRCQAEVGYGPKKLDRVLRLRRFLRLAGQRPDETLAGLAAESGYADQAHLARDCRQLTGLAPTALLSWPASRP